MIPRSPHRRGGVRPLLPRSRTSSAGARTLPIRRPPAAGRVAFYSRARWALAFAGVAAGIVWLTGSLLSVLIAAAVVAYLLDPVVTRIQQRGYARETAIAAVGAGGLGAIVLAIGVVVPGFARKAGEVGDRATPYLQGVSAKVGPWLQELEARTGVTIPKDVQALLGDLPTLVQQLSPDARRSIQDWLGRVAGGGLDVVLSVLTVSLLPIFTFYLLRDWPLVVAWVDDLVPARHRPIVRRLATEIDGRIASFVRGQLTVAAILAGWYTVGLLVAGLDLAVTVGMLSGALFLLPYVGILVGATVSVGLALMEHGFDWHVLAVVATFVTGQVLEGTVLTPNLVGDRVGLHPMVVMIALVIGGNLLGIWGLVVALPVTAALAVVGSHVLDRYRASRTYLG